MKKQLLLISLVFAIFTAFGQEVTTEDPVDNNSNATENESTFCPHRITLRLGGAWSNDIYKRLPKIAQQKYACSGILELGYTYFFNEHWGLGLGVGVSHLAAKATINLDGQAEVIEPGYDVTNEERSYTIFYKTDKNFMEKQRIWAIEIPLTAQFEHKFGGRHGIYAGLGVKAFIPFNSKTDFGTANTVTTNGYEEDINAPWPSDLEGHFGTKPISSNYAPLKMRASVDLQADFGGVFGVSRKIDLYLGVYCSYGFLNILPKERTEFATDLYKDPVVVNGLTGSNAIELYNATYDKKVRDKWHLFQVGLKFGVHIKPCGNKGEGEESMKDLKRRFMEEMIKKSNEPIIVKTTEYVYIVPVGPTEEELEAKSQKTKDDIRALAAALGSTKILFDLDKDIPKITDNNDNINRVIDILRKNSDLKLVVEGYTCDLGSEVHNRDLAERRAIAIRNLFINRGVPANQIEIAAFTYNDPQNKANITDSRREERRAAIFRIKTN